MHSQWCFRVNSLPIEVLFCPYHTLTVMLDVEALTVMLDVDAFRQEPSALADEAGKIYSRLL